MKLIFKTVMMGCVSTILWGCSSPEQSDPPDLTGTWELTSLTVNGKTSTWNDGSRFRVSFTSGKAMHFILDGDCFAEGTYTTETQPRMPFSRLDMLYVSHTIPSKSERDSGPKSVKAIYTIEDDILTICSRNDDPEERPTGISTNGNYVISTSTRITTE